MTDAESTTTHDQTVSDAAPWSNYLALESRMIELEAWGRVLVQMGTGANLVEPDAISVVGQAVLRAAEYLSEDARNLFGEAAR